MSSTLERKAFPSELEGKKTTTKIQQSSSPSSSSTAMQNLVGVAYLIKYTSNFPADRPDFLCLSLRVHPSGSDGSSYSGPRSRIMERRCLEEPAEASGPGSVEGPATGCRKANEASTSSHLLCLLGVPSTPRSEGLPLPAAPPPSVEAAPPSPPPGRHGGAPGVFSLTCCGTSPSLWKAVGGYQVPRRPLDPPPCGKDTNGRHVKCESHGLAPRFSRNFHVPFARAALNANKNW